MSLSDMLKGGTFLKGLTPYRESGRGFTLTSEERRGNLWFPWRLSAVKAKPGFTLVELLVVIAIIALLSSVVLASLNDARVKSRDAKRIADIKQLQLALELYYDANSSYPTTTAGAPYPLGIDRLTPTYISVLPKDPSTGNNYSYAAMGTASGAPNTICPTYHLGATLEQKTHSALQTDVDAAAGTACSGTDFAGTNDATNGVYDVIP